MNTTPSSDDAYAYSPAARKRMSRLMAVQGIYSHVASGDDDWDVEDMMESLARWRRYAMDDDMAEQREDIFIETPEKLPKIQPDRALLKKFLMGVSEQYDALDEVIAPYLMDDWSLDRMHLLLVTILRVATYELTVEPKTPVAVIIKEYLIIGQALLPESERAFLHAVLDRIAKHVREN